MIEYFFGAQEDDINSNFPQITKILLKNNVLTYYKNELEMDYFEEKNWCSTTTPHHDEYGSIILRFFLH